MTSLLLLFQRVFAQSKPDSNSVFNYYVACATGDTKIVVDFLDKFPDCVDIELFLDTDDSTFISLAYRRFVNYLISKGITGPFKTNDIRVRLK